MTLFDFDGKKGKVTAVGGDGDTHRRLVDMGLIDAEFCVRARKKAGALVDYGDFCAVTGETVARKIFVTER